MEKDGLLVGHGASADGRRSACYLRQTAEWWSGYRMPKLYLFADACLTWHSRAHVCAQPSTAANGGARTS
jgi:hypothetical protein